MDDNNLTDEERLKKQIEKLDDIKLRNFIKDAVNECFEKPNKINSNKETDNQRLSIIEKDIIDINKELLQLIRRIINIAKDANDAEADINNIKSQIIKLKEHTEDLKETAKSAATDLKELAKNTADDLKDKAIKVAVQEEHHRTEEKMDTVNREETRDKRSIKQHFDNISFNKMVIYLTIFAIIIAAIGITAGFYGQNVYPGIEHQIAQWTGATK